MNYRKFIEVLKSNSLKPVYLFYGEEFYLIDELVNRVKDAYIDDRFETLNYSVLEGKELSFDRLMNACETLPFMADKKIVVIRDFPLFKGKDDELEGFAGDKNRKRLAKYIESLEDYICLIFVEKTSKIRRNNFLYKAIGRAGDVVELKRLRGVELDRWVERQFKEQNKRISRGDIGHFIDKMSYFDANQERNLYDLENEIIKISNHTSDDEVNREIMDLVMIDSLEMNIFNLLDSISRRDGGRAIRLFNEMYMSNEPVLIILHMIVRQFRNMLHIRSLKANGYMDKDIRGKVKLSQYEYSKVSGQCNNFSMAQLEGALFHCLEADKDIKTSSIDERLALEILIAKLCFDT
ncbi:MAG: DNA polymerase III subunit delta [Tissierellia bacterium]|nr:DNA polymerase III subunit delta [Tissierellia bacterium]